MIAYGFDFPDNVTEANIHLYCFRHWSKDNPDLLPSKYAHLKKAVKILWPETMPGNRKGYIWSEWSERRLRSLCEREYQCWWGPSSSGKSTDAAVFALCYWLSAPDSTTVIVCSTTREMLERRIWREIVRFHSLLKNRIPGDRKRIPPRIVLEENNADGDSTINGIFGVAVWKGTVQEAMGNLIGVHNEYNILVIDEMQATRPAAVEAYDNLSTGRESKFLGMGNPVSRLDPLGRASEPRGGWNSISPDDEEWETKRGWCLYFDGLKSPGVRDPERYHFLLTKKQIDRMAKDPGRDSPRFWSQRRGFVPPEGLASTVISESFMEKFHIMEKAVWQTTNIRTIAGLDPSFTAGGDRAKIVKARIGTMTNGMMGVEFAPPETINLELTRGQPLIYSLVERVITLLESWGISPSELAIDTTGTARGLADVIDNEWARKQNTKGIVNKCYRVNFGGKASDRPFGTNDKTPCDKIYHNKVTELWYTFREFARNDQIRGVCEEACVQFCTREVMDRLKGSNSLIMIESKREMKNRTGGESPDDADAIVCVLDYVCGKIGIRPGSGSALRLEGGFVAIARKLAEEEERFPAYVEDPFERKAVVGAEW